MLDARHPDHVVWSTLWAPRPDVSVRFELTGVGCGTDLRWRLLVAEPAPEAEFADHMQHRLGELINANLRYTYGQ